MYASPIPADPVDAADDDESALPMFWLYLFAAILIVGLLFAFQQVVHAAVDQAAASRITASAEAAKVWRCKALPTRAEPHDCLAPLSAQEQHSTDPARVTHAAFDVTVPARP